MHVIGVTPPLLGGGFTKRCQPSSPLREEFGAGHSLPASYAGTDKKPLFTPPPVDEAPAPRGGDFAWQCVGGSQKRACSVEPSPRTRIAFNTLSYMYMYVRTCPKHLLLVVAAVCLNCWHGMDGRRTLMSLDRSVCPAHRSAAQRGERTHQPRAALVGTTRKSK